MNYEAIAEDNDISKKMNIFVMTKNILVWMTRLLN